jgi:hypothetical protein
MTEQKTQPANADQPAPTGIGWTDLLESMCQWHGHNCGKRATWRNRWNTGRRPHYSNWCDEHAAILKAQPGEQGVWSAL